MKYHRVCISLNGYAIVPGETDEEVIENTKKLSLSDFDMERLTDDVLEDATIIEECTIDGTPIV